MRPKGPQTKMLTPYKCWPKESSTCNFVSPCNGASFYIPFPHQVPKGPQTNLTVNPLQMLAGRVQYLPPLEGSTDKGYCKLFTFYKCRPWILGAPFLGHWDSGYLGSKVQGPRIREHKDRFQANGSTSLREGAKFKNSQIVVKKVKWTYFDVKWYKK